MSLAVSRSRSAAAAPPCAAAPEAPASDAPRLAQILAHAASASVEDAAVDRLLLAWLAARGRLGAPAAAAAGAAGLVLPGWCRGLVAAHGLFADLLPGWRFDWFGGCILVRPDALSPLAGLGLFKAGLAGHGPTPGRAMIAATFAALLVCESLPASREAA